MSVPVPSAAAHRQRILQALGVMPYALRGRDRAMVGPPSALEPDAMASAPCVLVMPEDCSERQQQLVLRAMRMLGEDFARAPRAVVKAGELSGPVPAASAYLAFGEAQARALGRSLPTAVVATAEVVLLDEPRALLDAGGKRRLWQAVGGLRRHWRKMTEAE